MQGEESLGNGDKPPCGGKPGVKGGGGVPKKSKVTEKAPQLEGRANGHQFKGTAAKERRSPIKSRS